MTGNKIKFSAGTLSREFNRAEPTLSRLLMPINQRDVHHLEANK